MHSFFADDTPDTMLFEFSRVPALLTDSRGIVRRFNIAFRELFEPVCSGCCGRHHSYLSSRLERHGMTHLFPRDGMARRLGYDTSAEDGTPCETSDLQVTRHRGDFRSPRFGNLSCCVSELPCIHSDSGKWIGSMVSVEIVAGDALNRFEAALDKALSHGLLWEVYASSYDRILPELFFYREALERHCAALADERIRSVIDIGAGTGLQMERLLRMGKTVTAVEVSRAMLRRLRGRAARAPNSCCFVIDDTAEDLPQLVSRSFDAATILLAFFDMRDPWRALCEADRLIVPGGIIVLTDPRATFQVEPLMRAAKEALVSSGQFAELESDWNRIETVAPLVRDRVARGQSYVADNADTGGWNVESAYEWLKDEGYQHLTIVDSHLGNCATVIGRKP
jgi:ubiquinone/menaquinone biosynthesis C-methylase UbiE